jgi:hypothetical protein
LPRIVEITCTVDGPIDASQIETLLNETADTLDYKVVRRLNGPPRFEALNPKESDTQFATYFVNIDKNSIKIGRPKFDDPLLREEIFRQVPKFGLMQINLIDAVKSVYGDKVNCQ